MCDQACRTYDVFISYASTDLTVAQRLYDRLVVAGFNGDDPKNPRIWFDRARLNPGCDWHREIEAGCESSRIVLPILTPRWKLSEWTKYETYGAERVVPILCEGDLSAVMTPPLTRWQVATVSFDGDNSHSWQLLFERLRSLLLESAPVKTERLRRVRYHPAAHFVGRERDLLAIHEALHPDPTADLTQGRVRAISALGGVGKTTIARQYVEKFWRLYPQIFWVDTRIGYQAEFATIHDMLFPERASIGLDIAQKARTAFAAMNDQTERLLILDNAEDEISAQTWIPKSGGCRTIITSRFAGWSSAVKTLHLHLLEPEPARELLLRRAERDTVALPPEELEAIAALAADLGWLPLALEQAAAYICRQGSRFGFAAYRCLYQNNPARRLGDVTPGSTEYPEPVFTTWSITIEKLGRTAKELLHMAAYLADTAIPFRFWVAAAPNLEIIAQHSTIVEDEIREALVNLKDYSMADFDGEDTRFHNLVQTVHRLHLSEDEQRVGWTAVLTTILRYGPEDSWRFENWAVWKALLSHSIRLYDLVAVTPGISSSGDLCRRIALYEWKQGDLKRALSFARYAAYAYEKDFGEDHHKTLAMYGDLGNVLESCGDFAEAEIWYRLSVEGQKTIVWENHPAVLTGKVNLGKALWHLGRIAEAETMLRQALEGHKRFLGAEHPDTLMNMDILATMLAQEGRFTRAEPLNRQALEVGERVLGREHPDTLVYMMNRALLLMKKGDYAQAEPLCRQALAVAERVLGREHPSTLVGVMHLAVLLFKKHDYTGAEPLLRRALEGWLEISTSIGHALPELQKNIDIYALCLRRLGHNEQGIIAQIGKLVTCYAPDFTLPNLADIVAQSASTAKSDARIKRLVNIFMWFVVSLILLGCFGLLCWLLGIYKALITTGTIFALSFALLFLLRLVRQLRTPRRFRAVIKQLNRDPHKSQELYEKLQREDHALYEELMHWIQTQQKDNLRQQVAKSEKTLGPNHADTIAALNLLAKQLESMDVLDEAEAEYKRALERAPGDVVVLGNYAFFLQNFRRNYAEAFNLYLHALQVDPTDAINHTNFAGLCLIMDNHPESEHHLREAWRLIAGKADRYTCRTLFLRAALAAVRKEDTAIYLGQLKTIFEQEGIQPISSRNTTVLDHLRKHIPADQFALFDAIYSAINKPDGIAQLQAISAWQRVRPVPLSSPWP